MVRYAGRLGRTGPFSQLRIDVARLVKAVRTMRPYATLGRPKKTTPEAVRALREDGYTAVEIAKRLDISPRTVFRALQQS
jgi:DNA invertase Pin-like site-specific DNA recombinase